MEKQSSSRVDLCETLHVPSSVTVSHLSLFTSSVVDLGNAPTVLWDLETSACGLDGKRGMGPAGLGMLLRDCTSTLVQLCCSFSAPQGFLWLCSVVGRVGWGWVRAGVTAQQRREDARWEAGLAGAAV